MSYDQYGDEKRNKKNRYRKDFVANPINVVMVTKWDKQEYPRGKEKVFLTTLRVDKPISMCMYNMCKCKAYRSQLGKKITEQGIRRFRTETFAQTKNKVVIIVENLLG